MEIESDDENENENETNTWKDFTNKYLPVTNLCCPKAARWIGLVVSLVVPLGSSVTFSVFAWQNAMRAILNQTETDSNVMAAMGSIGIAFSFPAGVIYDYYGNQLVTIIGEAFMAIGTVFLALATSDFRQFFASNLWLIDILFLCIGIGGSFMTMANYFPTFLNFNPKHAGLIVGLLDGMYNAGPAIYSIIYNVAFTNGYIKIGEEGEQNLSGFFWLVLTVVSVLNVAAFVFIGAVKTTGNDADEAEVEGGEGDENKDDELSEKTPIISPSASGDIDMPPSEFSEFPFQQFPINRVIERPNFWLVVFVLAMNIGVQETWRNNLQTYLRSFDMNDYDLSFSILIVIIILVSSIVSGYVSDQLSARGTPRTFILVVPMFLQTVSLFVSVFYGDVIVIFVMTIVSMSTAMGLTWTQPLVLLNELFGTKHAGSNWGVIFLSSSIFVLLISLGFSTIYQQAIRATGSKYCFGIHCFKWSFLMMGLVSFVNIFLAIWLTVNMVSNKKKRQAAREERLATS